MSVWRKVKDEVRYGPAGPHRDGDAESVEDDDVARQSAATDDVPTGLAGEVPRQLAATPAAGSEHRIPVMGARAFARRTLSERDEARSQVEDLRRTLDDLGALTAFDLERRSADLHRQIEEQRTQLSRDHDAATAALERDLAAARRTEEHTRRELRSEIDALRAEKYALDRSVVKTRDEEVLQEVGVYEFRHPLDHAVEFKTELELIKAEIKEMARANGGAVEATTNWSVNGSEAQGRKLVREVSKLMLRAYNAEVDALVRGLKPYKLDAAVERLTKSRATIAKLGRAMSIEISAEYHRLRVSELALTADYQAKVAQEKELEREEKARLREERKAQQELEKERERLEKERSHYANALAALEAKGDDVAAEKLRSELADVTRAIDDVDYRAANIRAGYVYVISNVGAFGERMVKIGMTRRLEPLDRVRELGDASVPFRFDVHALHFSNDAVGIENALHKRFAAQRVNQVNLRREFFYVTPREVRDHLVELAQGDLLEYSDEAEAVEFRQSRAAVA